MMRSGGVLLVGACLLGAVDVEGVRVSSTETCCCKSGPCGTEERESGNGVYQPDQNMCCKTRDSCSGGLILNRNSFDEESPLELCVEEPEAAATLPEWQLPGMVSPIDVDNLDEGSTEHTLHTHCRKEESEAEDADEKTSQMVSSLSHELEKNNYLTATRELFTMYACIRWAPDMSYWPLARDELESDTLPTNSGSAAGGDPVLLMARAVERGHFIPLRCSENIGVYDKKDSEGHVYSTFESRMGSMSEFFSKEKDGAFDSRAKFVERNRPFEGFWTGSNAKVKRWHNLLNETKLFSGSEVARRVKECQNSGDRLLEIDVHAATSEELLTHCGFIKWWAPKVKMYISRFPFQAFLAGKTGATVPPGKRVLLCFGKRVAGELHRRPGGSHILTDMNGVGCHGFWDYEKGGKMLQHIVDLWAPPTCQLNELELKMKTRMLSMFAEMNKRLFESLPAAVASEQFTNANPSAEEATGASKLLAGGSRLVNKMSSMMSTYESLGKIMSSSVMKWAVCPVGDATGLDKKLGSGDLTVQKYQREAYAQFGGKTATLPGEECTAMQSAGREKCSIGPVRQDYPEAYVRHNRTLEFACPARPPLPAGEQLQIIKDTHVNKCLVKATPEQLGKDKWDYMGLRPTKIQYQPRDHLPSEQMERVTVMDRRTRLDQFGISRDYVTLGRVCTLEVESEYSRWCSKPAVLSTPVDISDTLNGVADSLSGLAGSFDNNDRYGWASWMYKSTLRAGFGLGDALNGAVSGAMSEMNSKVRDRYNRIQSARIYPSIHAGEALWSMAFQNKEGDGGSRAEFNRWVMTVPCDGVDVSAEVESEFTWGEAALELLGKASSRDASMTRQHPIKLSVRSEVELLDGYHMRLEHHLAFRGHGQSAAWGVEYSKSLVHLRRHFGVTDSSFSYSIPKLFGLEATYSCGPRKAIYSGEQAASDFASCVNQGADQAAAREKASGTEDSKIEKLHEDIRNAKKELGTLQEAADNANENTRDEAQAIADERLIAVQAQEETLLELLRNKPLTLQEYDAEIVVRVDFKALPGCEFYKGTLAAVGGESVDENSNYAENSNARSAQALSRRASGCTDSSSPTATGGSARTGVVGAYMGAGAPKDTRTEVILSPKDVLAWLVSGRSL